MKRYPYVILGASIAGLSAARAIRSRDSTGKIRLIHGENCLPYKRTLLSKQLAQGFSGNKFPINSAEWYTANKIELQQGVRAVKIESSLRELLLDSGDVVGYESLLLATGAEPVKLVVPGSQHIYYLRRMDQAEEMARRLGKVRKAVSIGFGVQGIELADQFMCAGIETSLMGRQERLMGEYLDLEASRRLEERIAASGVGLLRLGEVDEVRREREGYLIIVGGREIDAQMVSASVGATPIVDLAVSAGIPLAANGGGVKVERDMKTGIEGIYAAGDGAAPLPGASWGLWHAAESAGMIAGINMTGGDSRPESKPHRLKCEAFGGYLFSMNYRAASLDDEAEAQVLRNTSALYLKVWEQRGCSVGAVLDIYPNPGQSWTKTVGRHLEQLILEGVKATDIPEALGI